MTLFRSLALLASLLLLAGCIEGAEKITLNPDGSGKAAMDMLIDQDKDAALDPAGKPLPPLAIARRMALQIVQTLKGVDAWTDVSVEINKDGRTHFKGTAYFKSLPEFEFVPSEHPVEFKVAFANDPAGGMNLTLSSQDGPPQSQPAPQPPAPEQAAATIRQMRTIWTQAKKEEEVVKMTRMKLDLTLALPGQVDKAAIAQKTPGGVRVNLDGKNMLDAVDKWITDDSGMAAAVRSGQSSSPLNDQDMIFLAMFGQKGPIRAHVAGELKPLFDYQAEMDAAKKAQPDMLKNAGLLDTGQAPPLTPSPVP